MRFVLGIMYDPASFFLSTPHSVEATIVSSASHFGRGEGGRCKVYAMFSREHKVPYG